MIIDGKKIADTILKEVEQKIRSHKNRTPGLVFILVGDNPASKTYVNMKKRTCEILNMYSKIIHLPKNTSQEKVISTIDELNADAKVDGILVQLPLPNHIDPIAITTRINPNKDVDGFNPINLGKLLMGDISGFIPCTPLGIQILLEKSKIPVEGKHVVIIGRSNIVGKPLAALLMQKRNGCNATVTIAHSLSKNLASITQTADILIAAIGKPKFITADMVKKNSVVIDVGMNYEQERLVGDVDFDKVKAIASHITPVPKGVGPMTIACLMKNTLKSFEAHQA